MEEENGLSIPRDAEQVAAEQGEVTEAQRLANEEFTKQIEERQRQIAERDRNVAPRVGGLTARIQQAQAAGVGK